MADADVLLKYVHAFRNERKRAMRQELKERIGDALKVPAKDRRSMNCLESDRLFVVFKDGQDLGPAEFADLRPLLRPAIVAACAAFETYLADRVMEHVSAALKADEVPRRLQQIPLTVGTWLEIEQRYERRQWGIRPVIEQFVRQSSSTAPSKVGETLGIIGFKNWASIIDKSRKVPGGATVEQLEAITNRRNLIAHAADRQGQGRARLEHEEAALMLERIRDIAKALDLALANFKP
jgi:hypothetical protein